MSSQHAWMDGVPLELRPKYYPKPPLRFKDIDIYIPLDAIENDYDFTEERRVLAECKMWEEEKEKERKAEEERLRLQAEEAERLRLEAERIEIDRLEKEANLDETTNCFTDQETSSLATDLINKINLEEEVVYIGITEEHENGISSGAAFVPNNYNNGSNNSHHESPTSEESSLSQPPPIAMENILGAPLPPLHHHHSATTLNGYQYMMGSDMQMPLYHHQQTVPLPINYYNYFVPPQPTQPVVAPPPQTVVAPQTPQTVVAPQPPPQTVVASSPPQTVVPPPSATTIAIPLQIAVATASNSHSTGSSSFMNETGYYHQPTPIYPPVSSQTCPYPAPSSSWNHPPQQQNGYYNPPPPTLAVSNSSTVASSSIAPPPQNSHIPSPTQAIEQQQKQQPPPAPQQQHQSSNPTSVTVSAGDSDPTANSFSKLHFPFLTSMAPSGGNTFNRSTPTQHSSADNDIASQNPFLSSFIQSHSPMQRHQYWPVTSHLSHQQPQNPYSTQPTPSPIQNGPVHSSPAGVGTSNFITTNSGPSLAPQAGTPHALQ